MKSILVPLNVNNAGDSALGLAVTVAHRFESDLEGLVVQPDFPVIFGDEMAAQPIDDNELLANWRNKAKTLRDWFDRIVEKAGMATNKSTQIGRGLNARWRIKKGYEPTVVAEYARIFDLVVMGQASGSDKSEITETFEATLFEGGRPVLLAPREPVSTVGNTVVISWNGSTETARTIALGMPFIEAAESVFVLELDEVTVGGPTGEELAERLSWQGISARPIRAKSADRSAGEAILAEAAALGADLLFKGAYTRSRLREMVFGGPTKYVLSHAELPVLMAH
jgi:nucleotide-binding universal stress UspA family protein